MTTAAQLSPGQARIVDPVLSQHARGYIQQELVARSLFPFAPVQAYAGQVIQFDKSSFRMVNTARAPGAVTKRLRFGYAGEKYSIGSNALEADVPREIMRDASVVPGIDLASRAVNTVLRVMNLEHEVKCANIARDPTQYGVNNKFALTGANTWWNSTSTPTSDINTAREAVRSNIGVYPNTVLLPPSVMSALQENPAILDRTKYTSRDSITTDLLANLWQVKNVLVGQAVVADPVTDQFGDVWGNDIIVAYVAPSGGGDASANAEEPSFAYTYLIDGMPMVEQPYWDPPTKSWVYGVSFDYQPVLSGMNAAALIQGAGAKD